MMSFLLPLGLSPGAMRDLDRACVAGGPDTMPWPTDVRVQQDRITLRRTVEESGTLQLPWEVPGTGHVVVSSATLMERALPYQTQVELARGKVNQLRCQAFEWRSGGLQVPEQLLGEITRVSSLFVQAVTQAPSDEAAQLADQALAGSFRIAEELVQIYLEQVFQIRHHRATRLDTSLGFRLGTNLPSPEATAALVGAVNTAIIPLPWALIEATRDQFSWDAVDAAFDWAETNHLNVSVGPLIDFTSSSLPSWLWHHERDLSTLSRYVCRFIDQAVRRYRHRARRWQVTAASNSASVLSLGEDELLLLTVRATEAARQIDPTLELIVGIAQPWGEYMASEERNQSPFVFADTLIRSGMALSALDVELIMGVTPRGSYCRDLLDVSRLLDMYALLGVPLRLTLGYPSSTGTDAHADPDLRVAGGHWHGVPSPQTQAEWAQAFATLAVGKPYVQGVQWCDLSDASTHQFPHSGLLDASGNPKPVVEALRQLREKHLS